MSNEIKSGLYLVDNNYKILHFNDEIKKMYPSIEIGQYCYNALMCENNPCTYCPLHNGSNNISVHNASLNVWLSVNAAEVNLPVFGDCYSVTLSVIPDHNTISDINSHFDAHNDIRSEYKKRLEEKSLKEHIESLKITQNALNDALIREHQYREQLDHMQNEILDSISCGVFAYTLPDYKLLVVNDAAKRMIGCGENESPVQTLKDFLENKVVKTDMERVFNAKNIVKSNGDTILQDYSAVVDGKIINLQTHIKRLENSDGQPYILVTMNDTTDLENRNTKINDVLMMQKQMADSLGSGIFAYKLPEYEILILNQEAKKMFELIGVEEKNFGMDIVSKVIPDDMPIIRNAVSQLVHPGDHVEYIFHKRSKIHGVITFKCHTKLLSFENGQRYILSAITDITEQELNEKRLNEERLRYRDLLAYNSDSIFTIDLTDGVVNEKILSKSGDYLFSPLNIKLPTTYNELAAAWFSEKRIVTDSNKRNDVMKSERLIECYESGNTIIDFEYYVPGNGKYYRVLILLYKFAEHIRANFIMTDITSSRHEKKQRISIIESLGHIYLALYHISFVEQSFSFMKTHEDIEAIIAEKRSVSEFFDLYVSNYIEDEYKADLTEFLNVDNIKRNLMDCEYESIEYKRKNLGWCRITLVAAERDENGVVTSIVFAGNIIDKQKTAELAQQETLRAACELANIANSAKTDFLANMSHDIRTPMNAIIGMTAIASTHIDDKERVADCLSKISISSKHLLGIINEVLDMSKIESGKMELQEEEFNLPELIDNLLNMSNSAVEAKQHDLTVVIRGIEHENVIGDSQRIQQVFMNLMSNAIKYTPSGGKIGLTINEKTTNKPQIGCYEFVFEDNGIGMSEDFLAHIFEPFTRATEDERVEKIKGTGLGMPITRNIVQMMNGNIKVESKLNVGTKMTVTFFLRLQTNDTNTNNEKLIGLPILVADADEDSCLYTCEILKELGMNCEWVLSGEEAFERAVKHHESGNDFFAVILDWKMPGMDGVETTRELRRKLGKKMPIVIISAYDWSDVEYEARSAGVNAFISKPLFKSRMLHLFNELVGGGKEEKTGSVLDVISNEDFSGKRALLVEDSALNAEIATEILSMAGLEIELAVNGKEAVDIMANIEDGYFSVIFMDIQMPIMNGYEAARAIRALPGNYPKSVPILAMTANAFADDVAAAKNAGMNEHIAKPLDFAQLSKALKKWIL